jgi:hypothetical protein
VSELPDWVKSGVSFTEYDTRWHIRGIMDGLAICRRWMPTKRKWHYEALNATWFEVFGPHIQKVVRT